MLRLLVLILFLLIASCSYSQDSLKTTSDSSKVPNKFIKAANKAYIELQGAKEEIKLKDKQLGYAAQEAAFLNAALLDCSRANDTLINIALPAIYAQNARNKNLARLYKEEYQKQKTAKVFSIITIPIAAIVGIVIGFFIPHR